MKRVKSELRSRVLSILALTNVIFFSFGFVAPSFCQEQAKDQKEQAMIGQLFNQPVPLNNYYFVRSAITVFGNKWGIEPRNPEELDDLVWNDLVLSFEAFRRNIVVDQAEIEDGITKTLQSDNVKFDWKKDKDSYALWVKEKVKEPVELFENQIRHIIQLAKLRQQVMDSIKPKVSDEEARQEFLNEQSTLDLEFVQFGEQAQAQEFYKKVLAEPKLWDEEKTKNPGNFKRLASVSLINLLDTLKIPQEDLNKMIKIEKQDVYLSRLIPLGFGIFKILGKKLADESLYSKQKYVYYGKIETRKKAAGLNHWLRALKRDAQIKIFKKGG